MYTAGMIASAAIFSFPRLCWMALTRGILALAIWSGFSVFQNGGETLAQVTSAYDFSEIKDLKSLAIRIDAYGGAFSSYHYSLSVHGDGLVEFDGHFSTFIPGLHRSHLSEAEVLRLLAAFREADFNSLRDESDLQVFDAPSIGIELSAEGHTKTVKDRLGESKTFRALMDRILEISHAQRWLQDTPDTLQAVLADTENLNSTDDQGRNVLMWACEWADVAAVRELIRSGANVRAKDSQGRTAMMYAAARQSPEVVEALLHFDVSVNEEDSSGETALHFAAGLASSAVHVFSTSADYHEPPTTSFWPGLFWSPMPELEVVRLLFAAKADPNAVDFKGATPLMYAAEAGLPEVLRALLAAGADPDAQDAEGRTALMYAADHCQTESVRSLVQAGVVVTLKDSNGYTALKRVRRKLSKYSRKACSTSRKQIIHIF
jgi:ankyrin repeat protein